MSLTPNVTPWRIKTIPGMNTKMEDFELQSNWVETAQNCRFEEKLGTVSKRKPISYYNSTVITGASTSPVVGLYRFYTSSGTTKFVCVEGTTVWVGTDTTGTWTSIRALSNSGKRTAFIVYNDLLMGFNGYDKPWVYDGSSDNVTWELSSCKAVAGSGTGITATSISYTVTYDTADAIVTGAVSNTIATVTNKSIDLSNIPLGPVGCAQRRIYRKDSLTAGSYRLVTTISNNTTTTYSDTTADVSATAALPTVTDNIPVGNIPCLYRERLFLAGDPSNPNTVYYSYPFLPHIMLQTTGPDTLEVSPDDNDEITGLAVWGGFMICIKKNSIRRMYVTGPDSSWSAEDPLSHIGTPAPWSVVPTSVGIVFLGWKHWVLYNGSVDTAFMDEFETADILPSRYSETVSFFHEDHILAAYTDTTLAKQYHDRVMRYNIKRQKLSYDTLNVNCFTAKRGGDETGEIYYGSSQAGYVYKGSNEELTYKLNTKSQCNLGTKSDVYVGGTEADAYIQIGSTTSASAIPSNICMLWDQETDPSSGWTEVTGFDGRLILISDGTVGTTGDAVGISGTTFSTAITRDYRIFKKNATTTEYQFPDGAIIFWDQTTPPDGFSTVTEPNGKFIVINTEMDLDDPEKNILVGTITDWATGTEYAVGDQVIQSSTTYVCAIAHTAGIFATDLADVYWTAQTGSASNIENKLELYAIKKTGEAPPWTGLSYYVYALYYAAADPGADWTDVSATYKDHYLYIKNAQVPTAVHGIDTASKIDWVQLGEVTHTETETATATNSGGADVSPNEQNYTYTEGTAEGFDFAYDRDTDTYREYYAKHTGDGSVTTTLTHEHTWTDARTISRVYAKMGQATYGGNYKDSHRTYTVYLKISGTWTSVDTSTTTDSSGSNTKYSETRTVDETTGWSDVTGIKVELSGYAYSYEGTSRKQEVWLQIYEVRCEGYMGSVIFHLCKKILGKMQDYNSAIGSAALTSGTWTSPSMQINASSLSKLYWNETVATGDDVYLNFRTGATKTACEAAGWSTPAIQDPNGTSLSAYVTADVWIQFQIVFSAVDTTVANPKVYFSDGFLVKFLYSQQATAAETAVEFIYSVGYRNFDMPMMDKIHNKIGTVHEGSDGSFQLKWETENSNNEFSISLYDYPEKWSSFYQDTAMGEKMNITVYKNDLHDFRVKEINGVFTPQPMLI